MSSLFDLTTQQAELLAMVEAGEFSAEEIADTVEAFGLEIEDKLRGYCVVDRKLGSQEAELSEEIKRLQELKKQKVNERKRLKDSMQAGMEIAGITKIDLGLFKVSTRKGRPSVVVNDVELLPASCFELEKKPNKAEIKRHIDAGRTVAGAELVTGKPSITIK